MEPAMSEFEHKRLRRLEQVWIDPAIYFVTMCVRDRRPLLANPSAHAIVRSEFVGAHARHGWRVGRYVIMPDHVHFFCASDLSPDGKSMSRFVGAIKEWSAKALVTEGVTPPIWQKQFFDHLLRRSESYAQKSTYVRENPVRAGLAVRSEDWPYAGEIEMLEAQ